MLNHVLNALKRFLNQEPPTQRLPYRNPMPEPNSGLDRTKDDEGYGPGENPKYNHTIAHVPREQVGDWFRGNVQTTDFLTDPADRMKFEQERNEIKIAVTLAINEDLDMSKAEDVMKFTDLLIESLPNSPHTRAQLVHLRNAYLDAIVESEDEACSCQSNDPPSPFGCMACEGTLKANHGRACLHMIVLKIRELVNFAYRGL